MELKLFYIYIYIYIVRGFNKQPINQKIEFSGSYLMVQDLKG